MQNIGQVLSEGNDAGNDAGNNSVVNLDQLTIGSSLPTPNAALEINSTNGAFLLPRMTTTQRDALIAVEGMLIFNTDESKFQGFALTNWINLNL